jgi:hypothetical protein
VIALRLPVVAQARRALGELCVVGRQHAGIPIAPRFLVGSKLYAPARG